MNQFENNSNPPNPSRFEEFDPFPDGTGFSIRENGFIVDFYYDPMGGWYDEQGNYYDADGNPSQPNEESLNWYHQQNQPDDIEDLLKSYEKGHKNHDDHDVDYSLIQEAKRIDKVIQLNEILKAYGNNVKINVLFSGLAKDALESDILEFLKSNYGVDKGIQIEISLKKNGESSGKGIIVCDNKEIAEKVVQGHGLNINQSKIKFQIEKLENLGSDDEVQVEAVNNNPIQQLKEIDEKEVIQEPKHTKEDKNQIKYLAKVPQQKKENVKKQVQAQDQTQQIEKKEDQKQKQEKPKPQQEKKKKNLVLDKSSKVALQSQVPELKIIFQNISKSISEEQLINALINERSISLNQEDVKYEIKTEDIGEYNQISLKFENVEDFANLKIQLFRRGNNKDQLQLRINDENQRVKFTFK